MTEEIQRVVESWERAAIESFTGAAGVSSLKIAFRRTSTQTILNSLIFSLSINLLFWLLLMLFKFNCMYILFTIDVNVNVYMIPELIEMCRYYILMMLAY